MKRSLLIGIAYIAIAFSHAVAGNYILTINGEKHEVDIDKQTTIKFSDGKSLRVTLEKKSIVSFGIKNFSFDHPRGITPSRTDVGEGIHQTTMVSPLGSLAIIQEYENMSPNGLVDMMLHELTKEEKAYGYKIVRSPAKIKLASGTILTGKKSIATYRGEVTTLHVLCYSIKDAGIMVITQIDKDAPPEDKSMMKTFWKTLKLMLK